MVGRRRAGKRPRPLALLALVVLVLLVGAGAGCGYIRDTISTYTELSDAGFEADPSDVRTDGGVVEARVEKDIEDLDAAAAEAAGILWRHLPERIDRLEVTCTNGFGGRGAYAADRAELEARFGPRDPDLDLGVQDDDLRTVGFVVLGLFVGGLVVLGLIVTIVVVSIRRSRRRRPPPGPPGWPPPPGPPGPPWPPGPGPGGEVSQPPPPHYGPPA